MKPWSLLCLLLAAGEASSHASSSCSTTDRDCGTAAPPLDKSARIAIVGGGVSGVSAAETLVKSGFTNVVVFEAGASVVPLNHAVKTRDAVYDLDLVYVPAMSWTGSGVEPRYAAVLREYASDLVPVTEFLNLTRESWPANDTTQVTDGRHRGPELRNYIDIPMDPKEARALFNEIQRFYHTLAGFYQRHQYGGVHACLAEGIASPSETFRAWAQRHGLPQLHARVAVLLGLYGNFPVGSSPACQVLMVLANKMPAVLGPGLLLAARQPGFRDWERASEFGPLTDVMSAWIAQIGGDLPAFMHRFRFGYGSFFESVVRQNRIDYRTNASVRAIAPLYDARTQTQTLRLDFDSRASAEFDHVVVAGRPDQVHAILPRGHPMAPLYDDVKQHAERTTRAFGVFGVAVVSYDVPTDAGLVAGSRFVVDHQRHQLPMVFDRLSADVNVMRVTKTADARIMTVAFQTAHATVGRARERELLFAELELYGFANLTVLQMQHYPHTPTRVPVDAMDAQWYARAEAAQGHEQLYFVGEAFSGHGVPTTFIHTRDWCVRTFALAPLDATTAEPLPRDVWLALAVGAPVLLAIVVRMRSASSGEASKAARPSGAVYWAEAAVLLAAVGVLMVASD